MKHNGDLKALTKEISDYLLTGMHHTTDEGRAAIGLIIQKAFMEAFRASELNRADPNQIDLHCDTF